MTLLMTVLAAAFAGSPAGINPPVEAPPSAEPAPAVDGSSLHFDARIPAEIRIGDQTIATLFVAGKLSVAIAPGSYMLTVLTSGMPRSLSVTVEPGSASQIVIGRTGLTAGPVEPGPSFEGTVAPIELRVAGSQDVMVQIGSDRWRVVARGTRRIDVPVGVHPVSVRSGNGTVVWAHGTLEVHNAAPVVIQLAEGRMPEVSGPGSAFHPGS